MLESTNVRIESELEIKAYLQNLKYNLDHGAQIQFQIKRRVDEEKEEQFTNQYTIAKLFPDKNPIEALRIELMSLTVEDYMRTVKDIRFPNRSEMREFGKYYDGEGDVYIKIRVELLGNYGNSMTFVMSFHFAERPFSIGMFPYRKQREVG